MATVQRNMTNQALTFTAMEVLFVGYNEQTKEGYFSLEAFNGLLKEKIDEMWMRDYENRQQVLSRRSTSKAMVWYSLQELVVDKVVEIVQVYIVRNGNLPLSSSAARFAIDSVIRIAKANHTNNYRSCVRVTTDQIRKFFVPYGYDAYALCAPHIQYLETLREMFRRESK